MVEADIKEVSKVYADVVDSSYISFSELNEGKAENPRRLSSKAAAIFQQQITSLLQSERHIFLVAAVENQVVGFALASLHETEAGHTECWLDDLGVSQSWRRRGIATALTSEVFAWGAKRKASYYLLESGVRNEGAHHFFEKRLKFQPLSIVFWRAAEE